jgi:hypothetical protein
MRAFFGLAAGPLLAAAMMWPPLAGRLESSMVGHMVVQIPLLALSGWLIGCSLIGTPLAAMERALQGINGAGVPGLLVATFTALFWMLPRSLDAALLNQAVEVAKFTSAPLLLGLPLSLSWKRLSSPLRGLIWTHVVAMLAVMGWLYRVSPVRLCNNYLVDQQQGLSSVLFAVAVGLSIYWIGRLFVPGAPADFTNKTA